MKLISIAAMGKNRVIGVNGDLPWRIPEDFRFFKDQTSGKIVIMGRKTFESLPNLLPGRFHIIVTRSKDYVPEIVGTQKSGVEDFPKRKPNSPLDLSRVLVVQSAEDAWEAAVALAKAEPKWGTDIYNIGGGELYKALLPRTDELILTEVDLVPDGDAFFPEFDRTQFVEVDRTPGRTSGQNGLPRFEFVTYRRKSPRTED